MESISFSSPVDEVKESLSVKEAGQAAPLSPADQQKEVKKETDLQLSEEELQDAAKELAQGMNKVAQVFNTSLAFSVDKDTGKSVIEVIDKDSEEVIRQIPPKQMLKLVGNMRNVMGMLLDIEI